MVTILTRIEVAPFLVAQMKQGAGCVPQTGALAKSVRYTMGSQHFAAAAMHLFLEPSSFSILEDSPAEATIAEGGQFVKSKTVESERFLSTEHSPVRKNNFVRNL